MTWFQVDDGLFANTKARDAGVAMSTWVMCGSYSCQALTGGFVPPWVVWSLPDGPKHADQLVNAGLWEPAEGGWRFHDWGQANFTKAEVMSRRESARQRQETWRSKQPSRVPNENVTRYVTRDKTRDVTRNQHCPNLTSPNLEELQEPETETRSPAAPPNLGFDEFWSAWPSKRGKADAKKAWAKATRAADPAVIAAAAARFAADPNREDAFTPHASTWLNGERWNDGPLPNRTRNGHRPTTTDKVNDWLTLETPDYDHQPLEIE